MDKNKRSSKAQVREEIVKLIHSLVKEEVSKLKLEAQPPPIPQAALRGKGSEALATVSTALGPNWETQNIEQDANSVIRAFSDKLQKKGINVSNLKKLGSGTKGVAFDMGDRVLKVTKDRREAQTSGYIIGKQLPNVVNIFDVFKFPGIDWYGVILEKLNPLPKEAADKLTNAVTQTKFPYYLSKAPNDNWNEAMKLMAKSLMSEFTGQAYKEIPDADPKNGGQGVNDPRIKNYLQSEIMTTVNNFNKLTQEYKMRPLFKTLKSLGITFYDFHGGNYGLRDDGTLVLFDLGLSKSPGQVPGELQEAISRVTLQVLS